MRWFLLKAIALIAVWASCHCRGEELDLIPASFDIQTKGRIVYMMSEGSYVFACAIADPALLVFDLSEPMAPRLVSEVPLPGPPSEVALSGHYAFVAAPSSSVAFRNPAIHIVDITDAQQRVLKKTIKTSDDPFRVTVAGNLLYVADASGVAIFDITDPLSPRLLSHLALRAIDIVVNGPYAYVATGYSLIYVLDVSDPGEPRLIRTIAHEGSSYDLAIAHGVLFIIAGLEGLLSFDLTEPSAPRQLGNYKGPWAFSVTVRGGYACVNLDDGIAVLDVSDPAQIFLAAQFREVRSSVAGSVLVEQSVVFSTGRSQSSLNVAPLAEANTKRIGSLSYSKASLVLALGKTNVFLASYGMLTLDPTDPQQIVVVSTNNSVRAGVISKSETRAITFDAGAMQSFLIDSNENFVLSGSTNLNSVTNFSFAAPISAALSGDVAFVGAGRAGLLIYDLRGTDPVAVSVITNFQTVLSVASSRNVLALVGSEVSPENTCCISTTTLLNLSDPFTPQFAARIDRITNAARVTMEGSLLVITDTAKKITSFDISNPTQPSYRGEATLRSTAKATILVDQKAYVAEAWSGFEVFDLSDGGVPNRFGGNSAYAVDDIAARGSLVFTATNFGSEFSVFSLPATSSAARLFSEGFAPDGFRFSVGRLSGTPTIQRSTDLSIWTDWKTISSNTFVPVMDADVDRQDQFYRLKY
jgi:hypothetical protein